MTVPVTGFRKTWRCVRVIICAAALILRPGTGYAETGTVVSVEPPVVTLKSGETETIEIWVEDVVGLRGFDIEIQFEPTKLSASELSVGEFIEGILPAPTNSIDNEQGLINFGYVQGPVEPKSGSGILFTFSITAKDIPGESALEITEAELVAADYALIDLKLRHSLVNIIGGITNDFKTFLPLIQR